MGTWDRIRALLRREQRDVQDALDDFTRDANRALDEREHDLTATPEEKLAREQARADEIDADLDAIRRRIEGS